jgi:hypothetical protein
MIAWYEAVVVNSDKVLTNKTLTVYIADEGLMLDVQMPDDGIDRVCPNGSKLLIYRDSNSTAKFGMLVSLAKPNV